MVNKIKYPNLYDELKALKNLHDNISKKISYFQKLIPIHNELISYLNILAPQNSKGLASFGEHLKKLVAENRLNIIEQEKLEQKILENNKKPERRRIWIY